mmetsp:Transcript_9712/g.14561  ORF Transcript_9712/g.14561 Transcript_9712/m.14561 type:complete len:137 (-) Transcript_9712:114-524(-)
MNPLKSLGNQLQKINLLHLIDQLERYQEVADQLDEINTENDEETKRKQMVHEAVEACKKEISRHLETFLKDNSTAVYEDWIESLHPDNAEFLDRRIDHRFYVADDHHRLLWNSCMEKIDSFDRVIKARNLEPSYAR